MWVPGIYILLMCGLLAIAVAMAAAFLVIKQQRRKKCAVKEADLEHRQLGLSIRTATEKKLSFQASRTSTLDSYVAEETPRYMNMEAYSLQDLSRATADFSASNHINGAVYHGRLNGQDLAIKKVSPEAFSRVEFRLFLGAAHHHPNILKLLGTSSSPDSEPLLVFEYAANGTLKDWLHSGLAVKNQFIASCYRFLTWDQRIRICYDVALSLQYMHQIMTPSYVHGNVMSRNIFLDENFGAKIGSFGMGHSVGDETEDREFCSTDPASWSHGYLAPEFIRQPIFSPCIDVFAFGVVLLEVLSGQTPIARPNHKGGRYVSLPEKVKAVLQSEKEEPLREWMDSALGDNYSIDAAMAMAKLARACVADEPSSRPNAGEISDLISRLVEETDLEESVFSESSYKPLVSAIPFVFTV